MPGIPRKERFALIYSGSTNLLQNFDFLYPFSMTLKSSSDAVCFVFTGWLNKRDLASLHAHLPASYCVQKQRTEFFLSSCLFI